jgi:hypothetical protein
MEFRKYSFAFGALVTIGVASLVAFNWLVDPYDAAGWRIAGINAVKPSIEDRTKFAKPFIVLRIRPAAVVLGSSRPAHALRMDHPCWSPSDLPAYNFAVEGTTIYETLRLLEHAMAAGRLRTAEVELDPNSFFTPEKVREDFDEAVLLGSGHGRFGAYLSYAKALISLRMTRASLFTIRNQYSDAVLVDSDGRRNDRGFERAVVAAGGQRRLFLKVETAAYIRPMLLDRSASEWLADNSRAQSSYDSLRAMIHLARANDIDLHFYLSPVHARQLEIYRALGLSDAMDSWKRRIVAILDEDATSNAGKKPFQLWDFDGYNAVTEESVPALGDPVSRMQGYWETTHYTSRIGDLILNRLLGCSASWDDSASGFGVQLTRRNIESRLQESRAAGEQYRRDHPEDVAEIKTAVATVRHELSDRAAQ